MKDDDAACTESTPKHHYDNERRHSTYRVNPKPPLRHWKTTHHVQSGSQTSITTMKDDIACTESIADHHNDGERRRSMYRVNPRPPLRQWKTTQHVHSQSQNTITTMKDDAPCTESTLDHHYDNETRHSMYRVNPRPTLWQWKTTQHVQSQP